jgi:hypothetical protein
MWSRPGSSLSQQNYEAYLRANSRIVGISEKYLMQLSINGVYSFSETAFIHSGLPFTILSQPYTANGNGVFQSSGPQFARRGPGVSVYSKTPVAA